jgi:hypothetical protein
MELPICAPGSTNKSVVVRNKDGTDVHTMGFKEGTCAHTLTCLKKSNLPVNSGAQIVFNNEQKKRFSECMLSFGKPQPPSVKPQPPSVKPPSIKPLYMESPTQKKIDVMPYCDSEGRPNGAHKEEGYYISRGPGDYISVKVGRLTCKEARECMNNVELSFLFEENGYSIYRDHQGRTVDQLNQAIRNTCVKPPPTTEPPTTEPPPPVFVEKAEVEDDSGNLWLLAFGGVALGAGAVIMYNNSRKKEYGY